MTTTRARVGWWSLTISLVLAVLAAATIGGWQAIEARQLDAADSGAARQTVLDTVNSDVPKLLSYTPDNIDTTLHSAESLLTGKFKESFTNLVDRVVIPGANEKHITATAHVAAAAVESLTRDRASMLVFVNQQITTPPAEPTSTASSVRVGLQKINGAWLIDSFDPI
jgi:Mce-associated membrane protein